MVRRAAAAAAAGALTTDRALRQNTRRSIQDGNDVRMRKRKSQQRQREMASRTRSREGGSRRRRERRGDTTPGAWVLLPMAAAAEADKAR
jgi:hypothetical protein